MIGKPMPERIYACQDTVVDAWGGVVERGWHTVQQFDEEAEYVRADLVTGDANAPLATGQYRWAKRYKIKCIWVLTRVLIDNDGTPYLINPDGSARRASKYALIGPVIRPPKEKC